MQSDELWQEFEDHAAHVLATHANLATDQAKRIASALAWEFQDLWGGMNVYFPMARVDRRQQRNAAILAAYDGKPETITRLAKEHRMTEIHIYRIIRRQRQSEIARRNPGIGQGQT
jgi:Mor family transcriptional regulator